MIPESFKDALLARVDIADLIGQHVQIKKAGARFIGLCPFHDEKTPSFHIVPSKQFFHCFGCGQSGDAIGFVMIHLGLKYREAIKLLADSVGMQLPAQITTTAGIVAVRKKMDAEAALIALEAEISIALIAVSDAIKGRPLSPADHERFLICVQRLLHAISFAKERPLTKYEIQQLTDSKLTPEEEHDLDVFAGTGPLPYDQERKAAREKQKEEMPA